MVAARSALRAVFVACVLLSAGVVAGGYATHSPTATASEPTAPGPNATESPKGNPGAPGAVASSATGAASAGSSAGQSSSEARPSGITVVTTDSNQLLLGLANDSRAEAEIVAYGRNGSVQYYNASHDRYWDVDPVIGEDTESANEMNETNEAGRANEASGASGTTGAGSMTVEYAASDRLNASACELDEVNEGDAGEGNDDDGNAVCARNVIERVNLTTGAVTRVYSEIAPRADFAPWNDVDRINDTHYIVADRNENRVFVVDTRTGEYVWEWYAASAFRFDSGGYYMEDWTHLNDVEYTEEGRIMASLRNHDQVVFLDPTRPPAGALVTKRTLGADNNRTVLYEQYNPDYIPSENGGPAILAADAENNRVVEYAYRNGSWHRSWEWTDESLQWPRDADRLPNGHTLVVDSNGDRVLEVDRSGEVVWNLSVGLPYDAERLGTGPESASGPSAGRIAARTDSEGDPANGGDDPANPPETDPLADALKGVLSGPALSTVLYLSPRWMGITELLALCVLVVSALCWFLAESYWRSVFADLRDRAERVDRR